MKRFLATLALTCVLSGVALAGDIDTCGLTSNEPPTTGYAVSDGTSQTPADEKLATGVGIGSYLSILPTVLDLVF